MKLDIIHRDYSHKLNCILYALLNWTKEKITFVEIACRLAIYLVIPPLIYDSYSHNCRLMTDKTLSPPYRQAIIKTNESFQ